jgi:general secretion pathway protein N
LLRAISVAAYVSLAAAPAWAGDEAPSGSVAAAASPLAAQKLERLSATRERPLFSPTRRPPPPPPTVDQGPSLPPPPPPPPNVALLGIVMDGEQARAVIRASPAEKMTRVTIGDDVGGWKVAQIEGRKLVLLSLDGRQATFVMFSNNAAKNAPRSDSVSDAASGSVPETAAVPLADKDSQRPSNQQSPARPHRRRAPN